MSRTRWFTLLTVCFFVASAAWADDLGYVDCASHPESAQLFSKARQTPDALGTVLCGERFTILVYGFVFSRVQTKDGKVGYLYSNLITPDRGGPSASQAAAGSAPASAANARAATSAAPTANAAAKMGVRPATPSAPERPAAQAGPLFPTPPMPAVTRSGTASAPGPSSAADIQPPPDASQPAQSAPAATAAPPPSTRGQADLAAQNATAQPALPASSSSSTPPQESSPAGPLFPSPPQPAPPRPSSGAADPGPAAAPENPPVPTSVADSTASAGAEPAPRAAASQPEAALPAPDPVPSARTRSTWERPMPGVHQSFLVELYSGYALDRVSSGATSSNLSGGMGSAGYNLKPWLQIVADTSYSLVSSGGVKNVLYGNHFGGRYFYRRNRWGMKPFAEGLVGGSRFDITVSGTGGYKTSDNCISYKAGGGFDIRVKKHWEIRVIDVDYYRTSLGGATQHNYWATAGVVLRLFGSGDSE